MIISAFIIYADIFLGFFIDLKSYKLQRFPDLQTAIFSLSICISPIAVLFSSRLQPHWLSYLAPIYTNLVMFLGFVFLELNIEIDSDWLFRFIALSTSIVGLLISRFLIKVIRILFLTEEIDAELKNL